MKKILFFLLGSFLLTGCGEEPHIPKISVEDCNPGGKRKTISIVEDKTALEEHLRDCYDLGLEQRERGIEG